MENTLKPNQFALSVFASLTLFAVSQAGAATNMFDSTVSSALKLDNHAVTINGSLHDNGFDAEPWTTQVYAQPGECVRLFVSSSTFDAKMEVIAPDGEVFRDDDSGGLLRPLVEIASAPKFGWYTVQIAQFAGVPTTGDFTLKYGRYTPGNPNCANPTTPFVVPAARAAKEAPAPAQERDPYAPYSR
jgi:hypothetical protein